MKTCKCVAKFKVIITYVVESFREHNHKQLSDKILTQNQFYNDLKRKTVDDMIFNHLKF